MKHAIKDFIYISAVLVTLLVAVTMLDTFTGAIIFDNNFTESNISEELTAIINESTSTTSGINVTIIENESNLTQEQNVSNEITTDLIANITNNISNESQEEINISIENVSVENVTNGSTSEISPQNEAVVNVSAQNLTSEENATNITNVPNLAQQNETIQENATIVEEKLIQYQAVVGQPVKWKKTIKLENETTNLEVELPKNAEIISIKEIENNQSIDITEDVISPSPLTGLAALITGLAVFEEPNATSLVIDYPVQEVEIEYETEAPQITEQEINTASKIVTVSSETYYENILTFTSITEAEKEEINLYMLANGTKLPHEIIDYADSNNNGLIDQISWITPHLSNQSFQVDLTILNIQSFPKVGGNWTVMFNTTGTANLTITPVNGTTYGNSEPDDLQFLELKCGSTILAATFNGSSVFYQDYSCNYAGNHTAKVFTRGGHNLKFEFGNDTEYAFNLAGICGGLVACDCGDVVVANRTLAFGPDPIFNIACAGNGLDINTSGIELSCGDNTINGSNTGVGINFSVDTNRSTVTRCGIAAFDAGILLEYNATNHYIISNNISYNDIVGINVTHEANGTNTSFNRVFRNRGDGIFVTGYNYTSLSDTIFNNTLNAIHLYNASANRITSIFANDSAREHGIFFEFVNSTNLTDIAARGNNRSGIRLDNSSFRNRIELGSYEYNGLRGGLNNDFAGVEIDGNSTDNLIHNNTVQHNVRGLFIGKRATSENNSFLGNTFSNNSYAHAIFNNSFNNTVRQQTFPNITIFSNSTAGDINYTNSTIFDDTIVRLIAVINITNNRIFVNATNITGLNVTADIILVNITFTNPRVEIEDNGDISFRACNAPECNLLSSDVGNSRYIFNVTHFTQYRLAETPTTTPPPGGGNNPARPYIPSVPTRPRPAPTPTPAPTPAPGPAVTPTVTPAAPPVAITRRDRNRQCWNNSGVTYSDFRILDPVLSTYGCVDPLRIPIIAQIKDKILDINLGDKANIGIDFSERLPIFSLFFGEEGHLEAPFKVRIVNWLWLILLIIAILVTLYLIRKEIRYLKGKEYPKVQIPLIRELPEKIEVPQVFEEQPEFPVLKRSTGLDRLFAKLTRFVIGVTKVVKLPTIRLPKIILSSYAVKLPKRILRKAEEKIEKEARLISLEREKRARIRKLQELKKQYLEVSRSIEESRHIILTKLKLNEKELAELESKFRSPLPSAPELMPHPEVRETPRHVNDTNQFNYLYAEINKRIQAGELAEAHRDYKALLLIYNRLLNEISNKEDLYNLIKSLHARLASAILAKRYGKLEDLENA